MNFLVKMESIIRGLTSRIKSIENSYQNIVNAPGKIISSFSNRLRGGATTSGGWFGNNSATSNPSNVAKSISPVSRTTFYKSGKQGTGLDIAHGESLAPSRVSTPQGGGRASASGRATVVPIQAIARKLAPSLSAPSISSIQRGVNNARTKALKIQSELKDMARTQPQAPQRGGGIPSTPPTQSVGGGISSGGGNAPSIEASAISALRQTSRGKNIVPTPPALTRAPALSARISLPASAIIRKLAKGRAFRPGLIGLPEGRSLEARPRRKLPVS